LALALGFGHFKGAKGFYVAWPKSRAYLRYMRRVGATRSRISFSGVYIKNDLLYEWGSLLPFMTSRKLHFMSQSQLESLSES